MNAIRAEQIEAEIAKGAPTTAEIAARLGCPRKKVIDGMHRLHRDGRVKPVRKTGAGNARVWVVVGRIREAVTA